MPRPKNYANQIDRKSRKLFVVACEGQRTEEIYLRYMTSGLRNVELIPLPTGPDGRSAPRHLLERLTEWIRRNRPEPEDNIELWMILDVDHHFEGRHAIDTHRVISEATRLGISVAISNPRFELWLLLHFEDVATCEGNYCEQRLQLHLGGYDHSRYNPNPLKNGLGNAYRRAKQMDSNTDDRIPSKPGTRLYQLMYAILNN